MDLFIYFHYWSNQSDSLDESRAANKTYRCGTGAGDTSAAAKKNDKYIGCCCSVLW
jgi:hypothetical protein